MSSLLGRVLALQVGQPPERRLGRGQPWLRLLRVGPLVATTPQLRTMSGRVRPCPTSVATMTQNVRKMTRSRSGNGFGGQRQGEGRRQRHGPAHARPRDTKTRPEGRERVRRRGSLADSMRGR
jgi:hypothetical protein